jgi:fatty acid synthase subunit alpha
VSPIKFELRYEKLILAHTGIRPIEPELFDGYNPKKKMFLQQMALSRDMEPIEVSKEEADQLKRQHGEHVDVWQRKEDGVYIAKLRKGAVIYLPKATEFDRYVAGQVFLC